MSYNFTRGIEDYLFGTKAMSSADLHQFTGASGIVIGVAAQSYFALATNDIRKNLIARVYRWKITHNLRGCRFLGILHGSRREKIGNMIIAWLENSTVVARR